MITVCRLDGDVVGFLAMLCRDDGFAEVVNRIAVDVLDHGDCFVERPMV